MKCIRCKEESGIPGFCPKCYFEVYGFTENDIETEYVKKIHAAVNHLERARQGRYSTQVARSIGDIGIKNPIIIDTKDNLLIGFHRFNKILLMKLEEVPVLRVQWKQYNRFTEGSSNWLYVGRMNGKVVFNVCRMRDVQQFFIRLAAAHEAGEDICPDYIKIDMEVFNVANYDPSK